MKTSLYHSGRKLIISLAEAWLSQNTVQGDKAKNIQGIKVIAILKIGLKDLTMNTNSRNKDFAIKKSNLSKFLSIFLILQSCNLRLKPTRYRNIFQLTPFHLKIYAKYSFSK